MLFSRALFSLILLGATGDGVVAAGKPFVPHSLLVSKKHEAIGESKSLVVTQSSIITPQLAVRGGAGPIDPDLAGKLIVAAHILQGGAFALAPEPQLKAYKCPSNPNTVSLIETFGAYSLAMGFIGYSLLVQESTVYGAIGAGFWVLAIQIFRELANNVPGKLGYSQGGFLFNFLLLTFGAYATLTDQEYATGAVKAIAYYGLANGICGAISPVKFATIWGLKNDTAKEGSVSFMMRCVCYHFIAFCTLVLTLLGGEEPLKAMAYALSVTLAMLVNQNFFSKDCVKLGMDWRPQYFWIAFFAILVGTILF